MAPGTDHRDAEWNQRVAQARRLPRREDDSDLRETDAKGADKLHQFPIRQAMPRLETARAGTQTRQAHGELRSPAAAEKMFEVQRQRGCLPLPFAQPEKRPDADPAE